MWHRSFFFFIDVIHQGDSMDYVKMRACGLVGKALPWHGRDQEFESPQVHHKNKRDASRISFGF